MATPYDDLIPKAPATAPQVKHQQAGLAGTGMAVLTGVLVLGALFAFLAGIASLTQATSGVGGIATACFLGILARLAQASGQFRGMLAELRHRH
jgi:hypothetical protein